jgi:hypothetical protein
MWPVDFDAKRNLVRMIAAQTRRLVVAAGAGLAVVGCCDGGVHSVELSLHPEAAVIPSYMWLGDSVTVSAVAGTEPQQPCYRPLYTAADQPTRFSYHSADTAVATISSRGLLVAQSLGLTTLTAASAGVESEPLSVVVAPAVARLQLTVPSSGVPVGDTLAVHIDALDGTGRVIQGAQVHYLLARPLDSIATLVLPPRSTLPLTTVSTPLTLRLLGRRPGSAVLRVSVPHETGGLQPTVADSVVVQITSGPGSNLPLHTEQ